MTKKKRTFSAEFKLESAQLVVDQGYSAREASEAMGVGLSTMNKWVKQLREERQGKTPKASALTTEQIEIQQLKKRIRYLEEEKDILIGYGTHNTAIAFLRS